MRFKHRILQTILILMALLCASCVLAQSMPDAPSAIHGYLAGGPAFDVRETNAGIWGEVGVMLERPKVSVGLAVYDDLADVWGYRAIQPMARYYVVRGFAVEAGYEFGFGCIQSKQVAPCDRWLAQWRTPTGGIAYVHPITRRVSGIARFDLTQQQLSSPVRAYTGGKDGGFRMYLGVLLTP